MTYREAYEAGKYILTKAHIDNPEGDAFSLLSLVCKIDRTFYLTNKEVKLADEEVTQYRIMLTKRAEHIPLQYITGVAPFMGMVLKVNSSVLIPRFDTEILVDRVLKIMHDGDRVLDMCTGSGCIILAIKDKYPMIDAVASDVSRAALLVAKENAKSYNMDVDFVRSDMFEKIKGVFDVIVSNPPYIKSAVIETLDPEVKNFEPYEALDGREDGLFFYRRIAADAKNHLKPNGQLALEIGDDQGEEVSDILLNEGYAPVDIYRDLNNKDRVIIARYPGES
ncbi:MAG: peptide chain release factor N(5)-glutamine methyltransferase [Lachnospiraceae bacterium]|nr:peptide chain release factor N(5)-glutamine methyltransferase [Lachnospiraceae bacterium]MBR4794912.1 peptide chain release factor N(5)-glutamine methyltransferase [Lachnospiraceae bacterium]